MTYVGFKELGKLFPASVRSPKEKTKAHIPPPCGWESTLPIFICTKAIFITAKWIAK